MKSKGGKIEWQCPLCKSSDIAHITFPGKDSGECYSCNTWWPWKTRIKISLKNKERMRK